jgi:hypothetical protein
MKQMIMTLVLAVSSIVAFAGDEIVSKNVLNSFNKKFSTAQEVKWSVATDYYKASFMLNDQFISAYYSNDGELMCLARNISLINLPMKLQDKVRSEYCDYWVTDLFEMSDSNGTHYYITVEKADSKVMLKSSDNVEWSVYKKVSK